jgi:hypothetical protein
LNIRQFVKCGGTFLLLCLLTPTYAHASGVSELARKTFLEGPGLVVMSMVLIGLVSWLGAALLKITNRGQIAQLVETGAVLTCLLMVAGVAWKVLAQLFKFAGLS